MVPMSLTTQIAKNTATQFIGKGIGMAATVATIAIMTRALGTAGFGQYATALALLQVAFILVDFGLQMTAVTMIADPRKNPSVMLGNLVGLRITTALGMAAVVAAGIWTTAYPPSVKLAVVTLSVSFVAVDVITILTGLFQFRLRMGHVAVAEVAGKVAQLGLVGWAAAAGGNLQTIVGAIVGSSVLQAAWLWIAARRVLAFRLRFDLDVWRQILATTWPLALTIAFNLIYFKMDTVILSLSRSAEEVGWYGAPYRILELCINLGYLFLGLLLPVMSRAAAGNETGRFAQLLQRGFDAMAAVAWPLVAGGVILAKPLMILVAGPEFAASGPLLAVLLVATAEILMAAVFGYGIVALGKQRLMIPYFAANAVVSLAAYSWLIPRLGAAAAAWLTVGSELVILASSLLVLYRATGFLPRLEIAGKAACASTVMAAVLLLTAALPVVISVALGGVIYLLVLRQLGGIPTDVVRLILQRDPTTEITAVPR